MAYKISSYAYVSMVPRDPEDDYPRFKSSGAPKATQIPTSTPSDCDHTAYICATKECVEGWALDYHVHLDKTIAGRELKETLSNEGITVQTELAGS